MTGMAERKGAGRLAARRPLRSRLQAWRRRLRRRPKLRLMSPLTRRILAVNVVALLIPVGGLLYLGPYHDGLVDAELESLRTQGEIMAGAIGEGAISITPAGRQVLELLPAQHIVRRLSMPTRVRARLFLPSGELVADSRLLPGGRGTIQVEVLAPREPDRGFVGMLMDVIDWIVGWLPRSAEFEVYEETAGQSTADYPEVKRALRGEIVGAVHVARNAAHGTRHAYNGGGGLLLNVAVPVQRYRQVIGALLLSKDSREIEAAIRDVRLAIVAVFAGALIITVLLSFYLAGTIARPVLRLAAAAERVRHGIGREMQQIPDFTHRHDEIGDLSGVLREMTAALYLRMEAIERFAADVSHEIKNPLTSLRSAVETAARVKDPAQQHRLMTIIQEDVQRLDRLITDISDASRLDAELSRAETEPVSIANMLGALADMHRTTAAKPGCRPLRSRSSVTTICWSTAWKEGWSRYSGT